MIKKLFFIFLLIILLIFFLSLFLHRDIPQKEVQTTQSSSQKQKLSQNLGEYKTVLINGREYKQARGEIGKHGGTFYSSTIGEGPKTFNPWNAKDATSSTLAGLMFDGLVTTDAFTGKVIPQMAKSVSVDKTGKIYTVTLRKGLKWSDGKEITADDVVFTWNDIIIAGFGNTSMRDIILVNGKAPQVSKIDKYTIKFVTPKPFAPFLRQLSASIAPKHILEPVVKKGKAEFDRFWGVTTPVDQFVISGMFKISEYIPAQRIRFVRNPDYYMVDKSGHTLPYLSNYVVLVVGDQNNEVLKFEGGELDMLSVRGSNVARFKELEKKSNYTVYNLGPNTGTTFLTLNLNRRKDANGKYYVDPIKQRWFNDFNFRKAVDYAIDREFMVANVLSGVGAPLFTAESLSSIFLNQKLKNGHPRDIEYSKKLLKESGYTLKGNQLFDKYGNKVEFTLFTNAGNTERESTGVMIKEDLRELGIKVNFKPVEFNVLVGKLTDSLDWDAVIMGLTGSALEPHDGKNVWYSTGAMHLFNMRKGKDLITRADLRKWEAELDNTFDQGARELNVEKRKHIYDKYQDIVYEQHPTIYLYSGLNVVAVRNKFGNIEPTPLSGVTHNLEEIYIK
ncbi:MAG: ABC transporter substrate-binding protein [Candidatus Gastranaerophilaceae bacterium]